jgi:hypothetical protein
LCCQFDSTSLQKASKSQVEMTGRATVHHQRRLRSLSALDTLIRRYLRRIGISLTTKVTPALLRQYAHLVATHHCKQADSQQLPIYRICENIAILYRVRQQYAEAAVFAAYVLAQRQELFGPCHVDTIRSESNLGVILGYQGKNVEAYVLLRGVYEKIVAKKGEDHAWSHRALHNLAMACAGCGEVEKAQGIFERLLQTGGVLEDNRVQLAASTVCLKWLQQRGTAEVKDAASTAAEWSVVSDWKGNNEKLEACP